LRCTPSSMRRPTIRLCRERVVRRWAPCSRQVESLVIEILPLKGDPTVYPMPGSKCAHGEVDSLAATATPRMEGIECRGV
jgi:hypothetical protein